MENEKSERPRQVTESAKDPEVALGGADAVNDTPGIARHGTTPGSSYKVTDRGDASRGGNKLIWLALIAAIGLILADAAGMLR